MDNEKKLNELETEETSATPEIEPAVEAEEPEAEEKVTSEVKEEGKAPKSRREKIRSDFRLKYGVYSTAITAIFIAVVILLNVVLTVVNDRYPITLDFTADKIHTINKENEEFIRGIDYKVNLKILAGEEYYTNPEFAYNMHQVYDESGSNKYFLQTADLLKQYSKYNKNIKLEFVDIYDQEALSGAVEEFMADGISSYLAGDILVECYTEGEDKEPRRGLIPFKDCYVLQSDDETGYAEMLGYAATYTIIGNNIEQAVANGIFKTAKLTNIEAAFITVNSNSDYVEGFKDTCDQNAISIQTIDSVIGTDFSNHEVIIICAPAEDYSQKEIEVLEDWLHNDGKKGKTLMFFGSAMCPDLPNLYGFLQEWGIAVDNSHIYYSKDDSEFFNDRTNIYLQTTVSDYTEAVDNNNFNYIADSMLALSAIYENEPNGNRKVQTILETKDVSTYRKPIGENDWSPVGAGTNEPVIMVSKDEVDDAASHVVVCASSDFLTTYQAISISQNGNFRLLVDVLNTTSRDDSDRYIMESKVISDNSGAFTVATTEAQKKFMGILFIGIIPLSFVAAAIFIYHRRKNY